MSNTTLLNFLEDIHSFLIELKNFLSTQIIFYTNPSNGQKISQKIQISQNCINTALIYFHKYFLVKKKFPEIKYKYFSIISCLLLSLKTNDVLFPFDSLINLSIIFFYKKKQTLFFDLKKNDIFDKIKKSDEQLIYKIESEILFSIGFDINVDLPIYKDPIIFEYFQKCLNVKIEDLLGLYFALLNLSFKLPLALYYEPEYIQIACIYMLNKLFGIELPEFNGKKFYEIKNFESDGIVFKISNLKDIEEICTILKTMNTFHLKMYSKSDIEYDLTKDNDKLFSNENKKNSELLLNKKRKRLDSTTNDKNNNDNFSNTNTNDKLEIHFSNADLINNSNNSDKNIDNKKTIIKI